MLLKFEQNRMVSKLHEILNFLTKKKKRFKKKQKQKHFRQSVGTILEDVTVPETIV